MSMSRVGYVYVVRENLTGLCKVGHTRHVDKRLAALRSATPSLDVLALMPGSRDHEQDFLSRCSRVCGEWIYPNGWLIQAVLSLSGYELSDAQLARHDAKSVKFFV